MVTSIDPASPISTPPLTAATRHRSVHRPTITRPEVDRTSMSAASSIETRPECPVIATRPNGPWHSIRPELEPMITSVPSGQAISMRPLAPARTTPSARISARPLSTSGWAIGRARTITAPLRVAISSAPMPLCGRCLPRHRPARYARAGRAGT